MAPESHAFRFFDLPAEIRTAVLELVILNPSSATNVVATGKTHSIPATDTLLTDVFLVCAQMYQEASAIFYTQTQFKLNLGTRRLCDQLTEEGQLFSPQGQDARRRIRNLTLLMKRIGGDFERMVEPALSDMVLRGSLRNLEIRFLPQDYGKARVIGPQVGWTANPAEAGDLVHTLPFQSLLRLLADPDLEHVQLWVWKVHWSIWCPFHEVVGVEGSCEARMRKHGVDWCRVDWKKLVDAYGEGRRIVKVGES
ncbi:uncharacterized protein BCR38DRAFT_335412 [Pseudomassariella vexata]|uniref:F-box domain-containing protein n=1 Tax=Pseudomassariella vexata TaxID=1141098 RepID=A0A1Y2EAP2_9PEZI|nr:uncharacterized protein BCR38DRAFT_335412 [Pseudomassariella vexata]ORY68641.1 hypothetical protein BCR38DRAFT_335412 [Pseudomassariella vexata]